MDLNETCSDSVACGAAGRAFETAAAAAAGLQDKDPLTKLLEDWGYQHLLPENVIAWPALPYALHVAIGIYLFASGKN